MASKSHMGLLGELWHQRGVRLLVAAWAFVASYDGVSSQTGLPKIKQLWGMSGSLLPWWGWLLILQWVFVYALFEYLRHVPIIAAADFPDEAAIWQIIKDEIGTAARIATNATTQPKPHLRLSRAEQERVTDRLIKLDDYLTEDLATILNPIRELLNWSERLRHSSAAQLHSEVEAMRQPIARQADEIARTLVPYQTDTDVLGLNPMTIKTKFLPLKDALRDFTDISQALPPDSIHFGPLQMPGRQLAAVITELSNEIDRVRRDIGEWRRRIAQGELD